MEKKLVLKCELHATPEAVYQAWLDAHEHCLFSYGGYCEAEPVPNGEFSWGDGYEFGRFIKLEPHRRILQTWRTSDFPPDADDSQLELTFVPSGDNCLLTLSHSQLPPGQWAELKQGWEKYYFEPMQRYFQSRSQSGPPG